MQQRASSRSRSAVWCGVVRCGAAVWGGVPRAVCGEDLLEVGAVHNCLQLNRFLCAHTTRNSVAYSPSGRMARRDCWLGTALLQHATDLQPLDFIEGCSQRCVAFTRANRQLLAQIIHLRPHACVPTHAHKTAAIPSGDGDSGKTSVRARPVVMQMWEGRA